MQITPPHGGDRLRRTYFLCRPELPPLPLPLAEPPAADTGLGACTARSSWLSPSPSRVSPPPSFPRWSIYRRPALLRLAADGSVHRALATGSPYWWQRYRWVTTATHSAMASSTRSSTRLVSNRLPTSWHFPAEQEPRAFARRLMFSVAQGCECHVRTEQSDRAP
jgi:hypothetical protein